MDERKYEKVKNEYSESELAEFKNELVRLVGEVRRLRTEKVVTTATMGASLKDVETSIFDLQQKIDQRFEWVQREVFELMDTPDRGMKEIRRVDNGNKVRTAPMTDADKQQVIDFGTPDEDK